MPMRISLLCVLLILTLSIGVPAYGGERGTAEMSGLATNALAKAFQVSGLAGGESPALRLRPYVVTIRSDGDSFDIFFLAQTQARAIPVVISAHSGAVIWKEGDPSDASTRPTSTGGYVLPGVVAGEIIAAHKQAILEGYKPIQNGAYNLWYIPFGGGLDVGFSRLNAVPTSASTGPQSPEATPEPGAKCFSGCLTGPAYTVTIIDQTLKIIRQRVSDPYR